MQNRLLSVSVGVAATVALLVVPTRATDSSLPKVDVIASGLDNPRGLAIGPDRAVYVAEAGRGGGGACLTNGEGRNVCYGATGGITRIGAFGAWRVVDHLPSLATPPGQPGEGAGAAGVVDLAFDDHWRGFAVIGLGADPAQRALLGPVGKRFGRLVKFRLGSLSFEEDLAGYEAESNPDGGVPDSNPYGLALFSGSVVYADAGANAVNEVAANGFISTLAVLPIVDVPSPFPPPGSTMPMQAVPTTVTEGPDGALYVGQLTGFPFPVGAASVYRLVPGNPPEVFATDFTNIIDLAFGRDGSLYVLQISANGLRSGNPVGALVRVRPDGTRSNIAPGALIAPGGVAIGHDGSIYVSRFATLPGAGDVVRVRQ